MTTAQIVALIFTGAQNLLSLAYRIHANSGLTDDQLREQIAADDSATRSSIDAFLATLPKS